MSAIGVASGLSWVAALTTANLLQGADGWLGALYGLVLKAAGNRYLQLLLVQHDCLFALGVVMFRAATIGLTWERMWLLACLAAACILEILGQNGIIARASALSLSPLPALVTWLSAMATMAFAIAGNTMLIGWFGKGPGVIRFTGLMTYPLYLVHDAIGLALGALLAPRLGYYANAAYAA